MRRPSPVVMKPLEMRKATTMSQMVEFEKPMSAVGSPAFSAVRGTVPVRMHTTVPMMVTAPMGRGLAMIPTMVARKIASMCQARPVTPPGGGADQMTAPTTSGTRTRSRGPG